MGADAAIDLPAAEALYAAGTDGTVGIEEEFMLLDPGTLDLVTRFEELQASCNEDPVLAQAVAGELIRTEIEIRSGRGENPADALDRQREAGVGLGVFVGAVDAHVVGQSAQPAERRPELLRRALEHPPAAQRKDRVAAEQRLLVAEGIGDVARRVAWNEEDLGLGFAEAIAVAVVDLDVDAGDACPVAPRADDGAAGGLLDLQVAADVITMMVGVQDMGDLPMALFRLRQDRPGHRRVDDGDRPALGLAHQPHVIVAQDRDSDDV